MRLICRRTFLLGSATVPFVAGIRGEPDPADPWSKAELIEPADLMKALNTSNQQPHIICVTFPVLYRQKHIPHARFAGPTNKPEGTAVLRHTTEMLARTAEVVIYCGCCPMKDCPNIRPAYQTLKETGFQSLRVLNIRTNFHTDWVAKGYPVESS